VIPVGDARYAVNCSLIFQELPVLERPAAARAAGFDAIEFWWPWETPVPTDAEVDAFEAAVRDAGVQLIGLNFFGGDMFGPDAGVASIPDRVGEFRDNVPVALGLGGRLGTKRFNALFGNRVEGLDAAVQDDLGVHVLGEAARAAAAIDGVVMVEAVSGPKPYPLRSAADAIGVVERVRGECDVANVGFLIDFFHLAGNGDDVPAAIDRCADDIVHAQLADAPGRHQPGTGELDLAGWTERLMATGYDGWIGLEYIPSGASADSFDWMTPGARGEVSR
jgi:hydroxypyruvate isomerase